MCYFRATNHGTSSFPRLFAHGLLLFQGCSCSGFQRLGWSPDWIESPTMVLGRDSYGEHDCWVPRLGKFKQVLFGRFSTPFHESWSHRHCGTIPSPVTWCLRRPWNLTRSIPSCRILWRRQLQTWWGGHSKWVIMAIQFLLSHLVFLFDVLQGLLASLSLSYLRFATLSSRTFGGSASLCLSLCGSAVTLFLCLRFCRSSSALVLSLGVSAVTLSLSPSLSLSLSASAVYIFSLLLRRTSDFFSVGSPTLSLCFYFSASFFVWVVASVSVRIITYVRWSVRLSLCAGSEL